MIEQLTVIAIFGGMAGLVSLAALCVLVYMALFLPRTPADDDPDTDGQNRADQRQAYLNRWEDHL